MEESLQAEKECIQYIASYTTTESDKTKGTARLLLSSSKSESLDLTAMGSINTPSPKQTKRSLLDTYTRPALRVEQVEGAILVQAVDGEGVHIAAIHHVVNAEAAHNLDVRQW